MLQNSAEKKKSMFLVSLLVSFFAISIVSTFFLVLFLSQSNALNRTEIQASEESAVHTVSYFITYKINRLASDLEFVSNVLLDHYPYSEDYSDVASIWLSYSSSRTVYDQIRYLDAEGNEIIRVNYGTDGAYLVPKDELQNKKDRYYFQSTLALEQNQVFLSPLDLNVENNVIEQPLKPMIRLGSPFFDPTGQKTGVVLLNYSASDILQQVQTIAASNPGDVSLLNSEGYWLYNEADPGAEWAFMFNPESDKNFASAFPEEWSAIQSGTTNTIQTKNGCFNFSKLLCGSILQAQTGKNTILSQAGEWYVVTRIPNSSPDWHYFSTGIGDLLLYIVRRYYVFYIVFLGVSALISALYVSNRMKKEQVKYYSEFDVMTNSYNRNAGIQRLSTLYKNLSKNSCVVSICFLDVNGLKEVNDILGHEAGDELLVTVAATIQRNIRSEDFIIRFGGDEFVVVFTGMGKDRAEQVWKRIVAAFETINQTEQRAYLVSVSHGVQELTCGMNRLLDSVLHLADEQMYEEKRRIKSNLQVIRK